MRWGKLDAPGGGSGEPWGSAWDDLGEPGRMISLSVVIYSKDYNGKAMEFGHCHFGLSPG